MSDVVRKIQEIEQAKKACARFVGAMDGVFTSPGEVYRAALKQMGHNTAAIARFDETNVARAVLEALPANKRQLAVDSATLAARSTMFPNANRLRRGA